LSGRVQPFDAPWQQARLRAINIPPHGAQLSLGCHDSPVARAMPTECGHGVVASSSPVELETRLTDGAVLRNAGHPFDAPLATRLTPIVPCLRFDVFRLLDVVLLEECGQGHYGQKGQQHPISPAHNPTTIQTLSLGHLNTQSTLLPSPRAAHKPWQAPWLVWPADL
jgi:hypothetical protein